MKRVSVVILNWNGVDMLRKFIPSVMDNSVGEGIEICVADNASSDGSLEMLRSEFYEAVMESKARVTYGQAQEVIDGNGDEK